MNRTDPALRLGHFFGVSPQMWLNLQAIYDLLTAEAKAGKRIKAMPTLNSIRGKLSRLSAITKVKL